MLYTLNFFLPFSSRDKKTVDVIYLTHLFMIVSPVEKNIKKSIEWVKVKKEVNELGLKFP